MFDFGWPIMKNMDAQKLCRPIGLLLTVLLLLSNTASAADKGRNLAARQANSAVSEQRIALVIGNGAYANAPLKNPVNDAKDMAKKLRGLGFIVIERNNLKKDQIGGTLREFRSKLAPGAVALVFYAGHGLQIKGINYLPAVDADINSEEDVPNQSIAVNQIMDVLDESKTRLNLVFLDACRNNPYARSFRSSERGLARVTAPSGTLISYATKPGSVAADGDGRNGLYTSKLLAQMDSTLQIEQALKRVVTAVKAASQGRQEPWMEGSIEGDFCFAGCHTGIPDQGATAQPAVIDPAALELDAWNTAREMDTEDAYQAYLADHADGRHAKFAQAAINKLRAVQQPGQIAMHTPSAMQSDAEAEMKPGKGTRGRLGVRIQELTRELAGSFGLSGPNGALISDVEKGGAAEKAGIEAGDVILKFDGQTVSNAVDLPRMVAATLPGSKVVIELWRKGEVMQVFVVIAEFIENGKLGSPVKKLAAGAEAQKGIMLTAKETEVIAELGIAVGELSKGQLQILQIDSGLLVDDVKGTAARAALLKGDVLLAIGNTQIRSLTQFNEILKQIPSGHNIALLIRRGDVVAYVSVKLGEK